MRGVLLVALLILGFDASARACIIDLRVPLKSADVDTAATHENPKGRRDLTPAQLQNLVAWLEQHRSEWQARSLPEATEKIEWVMRLFPSSGGLVAISVGARIGGGHYLHISGGRSDTCRAFGGVFVSPWARRRVDDEELASIRRMIGKD
jgi:hypothetical protein